MIYLKTTASNWIVLFNLSLLWAQGFNKELFLKTLHGKIRFPLIINIQKNFVWRSEQAKSTHRLWILWYFDKNIGELFVESLNHSDPKPAFVFFYLTCIIFIKISENLFWNCLAPVTVFLKYFHEGVVEIPTELRLIEGKLTNMSWIWNPFTIDICKDVQIPFWISTWVNASKFTRETFGKIRVFPNFFWKEAELFCDLFEHRDGSIQ